MTKTLYFDCFSGAAGDMILGALLDAGLPLDALEGALGSLALDDLELRAERVVRAGISATKLSVIDRGRDRERHGGGAAGREPASRHHQDDEDREHAHLHGPGGQHHDQDHSHARAGTVTATRTITATGA